jgi:hypothetical protein
MGSEKNNFGSTTLNRDAPDADLAGYPGKYFLLRI